MMQDWADLLDEYRPVESEAEVQYLFHIIIRPGFTTASRNYHD